MNWRLGAGTLLLTLGLASIAKAGNGRDVVNNPETNAVSMSVAQDDQTMTRLEIEVNSISTETLVQDGQNLNRLAVGLEPTTILPGWPELPMITRVIVLPPTSDVHLEVTRLDSRVETGLNPFITPAQDGSASLDTSGVPCQEFLSRDGFWPPDPIVVGKPAIMRGRRLAQVTLFPVQYNPATGEMRFNDVMDFQLNYSGVGENIVTDPSRIPRSSSVDRILESVAVNPPHRDEAEAGPERGSYLLIYPNVQDIVNALQPLIDWRNRQGWEVHTAQVQQGSATGPVQTLIRDAYNQWPNPPEMVVIVGDADGSVAISAFNQTDLDYVLIQGNDILAECDIGRISVESVAQLRTVVAKLVNYEADPWMQDTDWYRSAMVCAGYAFSGLSTKLVNRWVKYELVERGFNPDNVHEWYYDAPFNNQSVPTFFQAEYERGVAFSNYRGWVGIDGLAQNTIMNFRQHRRYTTTVLLTCSSGNYIGYFGWTEAFLRSPGGGNGAVGLCTNGTHVQFNNAVSVGIWVGFLKEQLYNFGTAVNRGRFELWRQYNGFDDASVQNLSRWTNLMGDPATHIFTDVPRRITVAHPAEIALGTAGLTVNVVDEENENPVPQALVCIYKANDQFKMLGYSDVNGDALFAFDADALSNGNLLVTVTKHNVVPYLGSAQVANHDYYIGVESWQVDDDNQGASRGDDDGLVNPGEVIELGLHLTNFGSEVPQGQLTATSHSLSPSAEVIGDSVLINQAPAAGGSVDIVIQVEVSFQAQDDDVLPIGIDISNGDMTWSSIAAMQIVAPKLEIRTLNFLDGAFERGSVRNLDVEVRNNGHKALPAFRAQMNSKNPVVSFIEDEADYPAVAPGASVRFNGAAFRIRAHPLAVPGMKVDLTMTGVVGEFSVLSAPYTISLGQVRATDPFGPDKYGYVCFDSGDEGWEMTPVYNWVEVDPNERERDFNGTFLNQLTDGGEDQDRSQAVDLPFAFQYYGREFNQITICTNGWAAFGNWVGLSDFRSRRINSGGGPNAQLCAFFDNLITGRICTHYDEQGGRFIIEWNNMQRQWGGGPETFEIILHDVRLHPTYSNDGIVLYQYKVVNNVQGQDIANADTPFATVGIGSLDDTDGLEYTYWNTYHPGAMQFRNEMAIKFTTATEFITGVLYGRVTDAATGGPIAGAKIISSRGFWAETNEDGYYTNDEILIGEHYIITCTAVGYNDSTRAGEEGEGYTIVEAETTRVDFALLHPEFNINTQGYRYIMNAEDSLRMSFNLSNDGNGTLWFTSRFTYVLGDQQNGPGRDEPNEQWDPLLVWTAGDTVDDSRLQGVVYAEDKWIVTGGGTNNPDDNFFYFFDRWGRFLDRMPQPQLGSNYGIRDFDYSNGYLYGVFFDQNSVIQISPETGQETHRWRTPQGLSSPTNIALDGEGRIWVSSITSDIYCSQILDDSTLGLVRSYRPLDPRDDARIRIYGLSWFRDDPDGYYLYIMSQKAPLNNPDGLLAEISLFKLNPATGQVQFLSNLPAFDNGNRGRGGICITPKWNNLVWAMGVVLDNSDGDLVAVMELAPNSSWINYTPRADTLVALDSRTVELTLHTAGLDTGAYGVVIEFNHNAAGLRTRVPVDLVITNLAVDEDAANLPLEYALEQNWPNPFNNRTTVSYSLREAGLVRLTVFDLLGREVLRPLDDYQPAGRYQVSFNAETLPAGVFVYRIEAGSFSKSCKMVLMK
ncbi:MAG: C25 family cysteine peptidase [Calditrichota bacterium]